MKVRLKCQLDNGQTVLLPGAEIEMARDEAMKLLDMGLVEVIPEEVPAKPVKPSTATKPAGEVEKGKPARGKPKKTPVTAPPEDEVDSAAEAPDNDSGETDDENQDTDNDLDDPDNDIPDPDSLLE